MATSYVYPQYFTGNYYEWNYYVPDLNSNFDTKPEIDYFYSFFPYWNKTKKYEVGDVVRFTNDLVYRASKFIYLYTSDGVDPVSAKTTEYGREYRVWHCIGNINHLYRKYKISYKDWLFFNSDIMELSDNDESTYYHVDALTEYYGDLSSLKRNNFSGKMNSFNPQNLKAVFSYNNISNFGENGRYRENGDLYKFYQKLDWCCYRGSQKSPYIEWQNSDYTRVEQGEGSYRITGCASKYDKRVEYRDENNNFDGLKSIPYNYTEERPTSDEYYWDWGGYYYSYPDSSHSHYDSCKINENTTEGFLKEVPCEVPPTESFTYEYSEFGSSGIGMSVHKISESDWGVWLFCFNPNEIGKTAELQLMYTKITGEEYTYDDGVHSSCRVSDTYVDRTKIPVNILIKEKHLHLPYDFRPDISKDAPDFTYWIPSGQSADVFLIKTS